MNSLTHFDLWTDHPYHVSDLIKELEATNTTLSEVTCVEIVDKLLEAGFRVANEINASSPSSGVQQSQVLRSDAQQEQTGASGVVGLYGSGAVYDEFGTGEEGASNPHPMKGNFDLNPYNSGPYVSTHINPFDSRHYWIFEPMSGKPYFDLFGIPGYTEGIPSGKQIYSALNEIQSVKNNIVAEEINDAIRTLI